LWFDEFPQVGRVHVNWRRKIAVADFFAEHEKKTILFVKEFAEFVEGFQADLIRAILLALLHPIRAESF
jgi:hypothetical protein